jgi:hypothetical protein
MHAMYFGGVSYTERKINYIQRRYLFEIKYEIELLVIKLTLKLLEIVFKIERQDLNAKFKCYY